MVCSGCSALLNPGTPSGFSLIMGTSAEQGILMDVVVGIAGGLIGGFLTSLLGAVVLLAVLRFFRGRR
nr:hypothetical protein [uncultured Corynebacterium sp.]